MVRQAHHERLIFQSFLNKVDMQELDNAVNNSIKEVATRFDFRNSKTTIELNKKDKVINIVTADKMKMDAL